MTFDMVIAVIRIQGNSGDTAGNVTSFPWGLSNFGIRIKLRPVGKPLFYGRRKAVMHLKIISPSVYDQQRILTSVEFRPLILPQIKIKGKAILAKTHVILRDRIPGSKEAGNEHAEILRAEYAKIGIRSIRKTEGNLTA
ncbi:MAG: hypothetical protein VZR11_08175 [Succinimonas sp.]|nr:hypothetical protein [Succinimonas sp.]